jgi:hypothetical protein
MQRDGPRVTPRCPRDGAKASCPPTSDRDADDVVSFVNAEGMGVPRAARATAIFDAAP